MPGKTCPMLNSKCIEIDCELFLDDADECALVSLANNLWRVTLPQYGGGALKVVKG